MSKDDPHGANRYAARQRADEVASSARINETATLKREDADRIARSRDAVQKSMKLLRDSNGLVKRKRQRRPEP
jgi:hypothetical protein